MATFITTLHFTEQGIKVVRDTCERAAAFKATARKMGVKVTGIYWTLGAFDGVIVLEAPDEETATAALLHLGSLGNVRTQTARAYDTAEMEKIIGLLPEVRQRIASMDCGPSPLADHATGAGEEWP